MKSIMQAVVVAGFAALALTGAARAQITENGPYYAAPSWDQTFPASTRFVVLTNLASAAVLDRETGLVWEQNPSSNTTVLFTALSHCYSLTTGGRGGWRLPRVEELMSLVPLPAGHPFTNISGHFYWSNTPYAPGLAGNATVAVDIGEVDQSDPVESAESGTNVFAAWCVRGGSGSAGTSTDH